MSDTLTFPALTASEPAPTRTATDLVPPHAALVGDLTAVERVLDRLYAAGATECEIVVLGPSTFVVR